MMLYCTTDSIDIPVITEVEASRATVILRTRSIADIDGIPPFFPKGIVELIAPDLLQLYSLSLQSATFSECWKFCFGATNS